MSPPFERVHGDLCEVDAKDEDDPPELADDLDHVEHQESTDRPLEPTSFLG